MIIDFLKTTRPKEELLIALKVLLEFKECESVEEYLEHPFVVWSKLEQLEEYLEHLVFETPLQKDTQAEVQRGTPDT